MDKNNKGLEKELEEFLNNPSNRIMRGLSRLTVFSITSYAGWWGIASYINHRDEIGMSPLIVLGALGLSYVASRIQGHLYNKIAERDFKNNRSNP